jgi:hypothetical protein
MLALGYVLALLGGIAPFTRRFRADMGWARIALCLAGLLSVVWSFLGATMLFWRHHFTHYAYFLLGHYKTMCTGGGLISFIFSASLRRPLAGIS